MLQGIGTLAGVAAVIIGAHIGANAWRQQKLAERRLEMAERILTATHKGRAALSYIRTPMMFGGEIDKALEELKKFEGYSDWPRERRERMPLAQAYLNRVVNCRPQVEALDDCLPLARAMFGESVENSLEIIRQQFWALRTWYEAYANDWNGTDPAFTIRIRRAMYEIEPRDGEPNEISEAITNAVTVIESALEPALRLEQVGLAKASSSAP
ncbi:hypothetical protein [Sphingomonas sp. NFR04]|uniref:hypothetical protein n=1 Tax=Sphingomonas sp. NFR04 TaxID=1566283 RepID=UPI000B8719DA|nr:hypothetical protein [Sphingomonas sp. NFR04]